MKNKFLVAFFALLAGMLLALSAVQDSNASKNPECVCEGSKQVCCKFSDGTTYFGKFIYKGEPEELEPAD